MRMFKPGDLVWATPLTEGPHGTTYHVQVLALVVGLDKPRCDEESWPGRAFFVPWYVVEGEDGRRFSTCCVFNHYLNAPPSE